MTPKSVYDWFCLYFPQYASYVVSWYPHEKNSVRVKQSNGTEFIFTYKSKMDWRFETVKSCSKGTRGEKTMTELKKKGD